MADIAIPRDANALDVEWFRQVLETSCPGITQRLVSIAIEQIGQGVGLVADLYRIVLSYNDPSDADPRELVVKKSSTSPENVKLAKFFSLYLREYLFYSKLQPLVKTRSPRLYYGDFDRRTHQFVLVLEDLSEYTAQNQLTGATPRQAIAAVKSIALMHARFWNAVDVDELKTAYKTTSPLHSVGTHFIYRTNVPRVLKNFSDLLNADTRWAIEEYGRLCTEMMIVSSSEDATFIHGDYRLDNLFFDGEDQVIALDWQISGITTGFFDVAYFLSGSLATETRREVEREAIREYCNTISNERGEVLDFETGWRYYRMGVLSSLLIAVIGAGGLDLSEERSKELLTEGLRRTVKAIQDLNAAAFLSQRVNRWHYARILNTLVNMIFYVYSALKPQ